MTIYHLVNMFKRTFSNRELIEQYVTSENDMEKKAFGLAIDGYPFNK